MANLCSRAVTAGPTGKRADCSPSTPSRRSGPSPNPSRLQRRSRAARSGGPGSARGPLSAGRRGAWRIRNTAPIAEPSFRHAPVLRRRFRPSIRGRTPKRLHGAAARPAARGRRRLGVLERRPQRAWRHCGGGVRRASRAVRGEAIARACRHRRRRLRPRSKPTQQIGRRLPQRRKERTDFRAHRGASRRILEPEGQWRHAAVAASHAPLASIAFVPRANGCSLARPHRPPACRTRWRLEAGRGTLVSFGYGWAFRTTPDGAAFKLAHAGSDGVFLAQYIWRTSGARTTASSSKWWAISARTQCGRRASNCAGCCAIQCS